MTVREHPHAPGMATRGRRRADRRDREQSEATWSRAELAEVGRRDRGQGEAASPPAELAEADRLVADLAALIDAGLVAVRPHVLGPARYEAVSEQRQDLRSALSAAADR
jgi:hypothetical protein